MTDDKRLIEDYLPIEAISAEASREKSVRKGHISTLHLWWARRPLVACRAAVYGALVPASQFVPNGASDEKKKSLGRANAAKFVKSLCQYPGSPAVIKEAQNHILKAHADRLTQEISEWQTGKTAKPTWIDEFNFAGSSVTQGDIEDGRAPRPRVLDMFAGGGAIPLEALRLGCEAYALDLNPVAHIIELCTLVYPQRYGKPDPAVRGMTGPKNDKGETTWGGLANEVRYWGGWMLKKVKAEIGDLYPLIPDPAFKGRRQEVQMDWLKDHDVDDVPPGYLMPVAYLWTRTVTCKNPSCRATVPLVRQTWLCKKSNRCVALKMIALQGQKTVRFEVVETTALTGLGFNPAGFSKSGNATCPFCGTVADNDYVKAEACSGRMSSQRMTTICIKPGKQGKIYLSVDDLTDADFDDTDITKRIDILLKKTGLTLPSEGMDKRDPTTVAGRGFGFAEWASLFVRRQLLYLMTLAGSVSIADNVMRSWGITEEHSSAIISFLGILVDRQADYNSAQCIWESGGEFIKSTFTRQALPMVWDFVEQAPFGGASGSPEGAIGWITAAIDSLSHITLSGVVSRGSATSLPWKEQHFDAVITDPPYYDNVSYAVLSDFFYVWLKRSVGYLYPDHFVSQLTPKKNEAIADTVRHGGKENSRNFYENVMARSFSDAHRVLKFDGESLSFMLTRPHLAGQHSLMLCVVQDL